MHRANIPKNVSLKIQVMTRKGDSVCIYHEVHGLLTGFNRLWTGSGRVRKNKLGRVKRAWCGEIFLPRPHSAISVRLCFCLPYNTIGFLSVDKLDKNNTDAHFPCAKSSYFQLIVFYHITIVWIYRTMKILQDQTLCTSQFQNRPSPPPGQSPGIWLTLSSVQWGIWPKMRPARWGIRLSCQTVCQRSEAKGFRNSLI